MTDTAIRGNTEAHRYELPVGNVLAVVIYNLSGQNLMIIETLAPEALEGRGSTAGWPGMSSVTPEAGAC